MHQKKGQEMWADMGMKKKKTIRKCLIHTENGEVNVLDDGATFVDL